MRSFPSPALTAFLVLFFLGSMASAQTWGPTSFFELTADVSKDRIPRIQEHLSFMVDYLGAQDVRHLTLQQRQNRSRLIDRLDAYGREEMFPRNRTLPGVSPIFIDPDGRACAVADPSGTGFVERSGSFVSWG